MGGVGGETGRIEAGALGPTRTLFTVHVRPAGMSNLDEFLAGERLDDVVFYLSDAYLDDDSRLRNVGTETDVGFG